MSDMRDARLRRALESAPDADRRPDPETRRAVLEAARKAVEPPPAVSWWARLWQGMGERSLPWNAALATVVLATLVTVLWREQEIPGVRPDLAPTSEPAPTAHAPAAPPPAQPSTPAAPPPKAAPPAQRRTQPAPVPAPPQQAEPPRERRAEVAVDALRDREVRELAKSGTAPPSPEPSMHADLAAAAPRAPAPAMSRAESSATHWTHVRITDSGRSLELTREQAPRLAQLLDGMAREARSQEPLEIAVTQRAELTREGELAGVIELAGPQVRWTPAGRNSFTARPEQARLQALREEIGRALQR